MDITDVCAMQLLVHTEQFDIGMTVNVMHAIVFKYLMC